MGVSGLWNLLLPIARHLSIETLTDKTLAIDASIWLTQFIKAMRDEEGKVNRNAHLLGVIRRVLRLMYHGIRPVFVFDGIMPEVKRREIRERNRRRDGEEGNIKRTAKKLLIAKLKEDKAKGILSLQQKEGVKEGNGRKKNAAFNEGFNEDEDEDEDEAVEEDIDNDEEKPPQPTQPTQQPTPPSSSTKTQYVTELLGDSDSDQDVWEDGASHHTHTSSHHTNSTTNDNDIWETYVPTTNLDISVIKNLPASMKADVIEKAKAAQRVRARKEYLPLSDDPLGYSNCQLVNFLKGAKLNRDIKIALKEEEESKDRMQSDKAVELVYGAMKRLDGDDDESDDEEGEEFKSNSMKRKSKQKSQSNASDDDDDRVKRNKKKVYEDDDYDDSDDEIEEVLPPRSSMAYTTKQGSSSSSSSSSSKPYKSTSKSTSSSSSSSSSHPNNFYSNKQHKDPQTLQIERDESFALALQEEDDAFGYLNPSYGGKRDKVEEVWEKLPKGSGGMDLDDDDDDDDDDHEDGGFEGGGFVVDVKKSSSVAKKQYDDDDDDDEVEEEDYGGGFILEDSATTTSSSLINATAVKQQNINENYGEYDDGDDDDDDVNDNDDNGMYEGGGFLNDDSEGFANEQNAEQNEEPIVYNAEEEGSDDEDDYGGGGFIVDEKLKEPVVMSIDDAADGDDDEEDYVGGFIVDNKRAESSAESKGFEQQPVVAKLEEEIDQEELGDEVNWEDGEGVEDEAISVNENDTTANLEQEESDDEDEDEDEVNWEEGQDIERDDGVDVTEESQTTTTTTITTATTTATTTSTTHTSAQELEDEVNWEDGGEEEEDEDEDEKECIEIDMSTTSDHPNIFTLDMFKRKASSPIEEGGEEDEEDEEDDEEDGRMERSEEQSATNSGDEEDEFSIASQPKHLSAGQVETFSSAQADAAKMGSWIGRAFERGLKDFRREMGIDEAKPVVAKPIVKPIQAIELKDDDDDDLIEEVTPIAPPVPPKPVTQADLNSLREDRQRIQAEYNRSTRDADTVTDEMFNEVIELLEIFGIPYVRAPSEAEAQCAQLEMLGLVDGIVTEDSDVFVFGGKTVYRHLFEDKKVVEVYMAKDAEVELALKREHFVSLAMLLGGDYTSGVKGIGVVNGMEVLSAFPVEVDPTAGLGKFREWLEGFDPQDLAVGNIGTNETMSLEKKFHQKHKRARNRWLAPQNFPAKDALHAYMKPVVDVSTERFSWGEVDLEELRIFCAERIGWSLEETDRFVLPVLKKMEERKKGDKQTKMDSWLVGYDQGKKVGEVKSKRLIESLKVMTGGEGRAGGKMKKVEKKEKKGEGTKRKVREELEGWKVGDDDEGEV